MASVKPRPGYGYEVRYIDPATGKRPSKTFKLKKDADAYRRKVEREIEDGTHVADGDTMTFKQASTAFLDHQEQRQINGQIGLARYRKLESSIRRVLVPAAGHIALNRLQIGDVERMYRGMLAGGTMLPATARERIFDLKMVQDFAIKRKWMKNRPVDEVLADLKGIKKRRRRVATQEEIKRLLSTVAVRKFNGTARSQARIECMVHLGVFCGLRQGEMLGLKVEHIDLDGGVIAIRHSLLAGDILKGPKTAAGTRDIRVPAHVIALLRSYLARFYRDQDRNPHRLAFRTEKGCEFDKATLHRQWHDTLARAGIEEETGPLTFHSLRHFCASWMIQNAMPLTEVARYLGHEHFDTTLQIYAHPVMTEASRHAAIDRGAVLLTSANDAGVTQQALSA